MVTLSENYSVVSSAEGILSYFYGAPLGKPLAFVSWFHVLIKIKINFLRLPDHCLLPIADRIHFSTILWLWFNLVHHRLCLIVLQSHFEALFIISIY